MHFKKQLFILLLSFSSFTAFASDTLKVFQYNLLRYGDNTCNTLGQKDKYLRQILHYAMPDIIGVNEMLASDLYGQNILINDLNSKGVNGYKKAAFTNINGSSDIANMLFYNSKKLALHSQTVISTFIRDVNLYKLYYVDPDLATTHDTAYINVIICHLKAGNTGDDAIKRTQMTKNIMDYLAKKSKDDGYIIMGDMNVYTSNEDCFQNLINPSNSSLIIFNDPAKMLGDWHGNSHFASYMSQSTRTGFPTDCASGGGMNDRFDHILVSDTLLSSANTYSYISGSFAYLGQDGKHYNNSINYNENKSVPDTVLNSLYNMSDHIPVTLKLNVNRKKAGSGIGTQAQHNKTFTVSPSPFQNHVLFHNNADMAIEIKLYDVSGKMLMQSKVNPNTDIQLNTSGLARGIYIARSISPCGDVYSEKLYKNE